MVLSGAGEMAQLAKYLAHKLEDLSSDPQHTREAKCHMYLSPSAGEIETGKSMDSLASQPS